MPLDEETELTKSQHPSDSEFSDDGMNSDIDGDKKLVNLIKLTLHIT